MCSIDTKLAAMQDQYRTNNGLMLMGKTYVVMMIIRLLNTIKESDMMQVWEAYAELNRN